MSKRIGKNCKVTLGADSIIGMGTWKIEGVTSDMIESTEFGDNWKDWMFGAKDGGSVTFSGSFDPDDNTGVYEIIEANNENTNLTDLRCYIDNTSYFHPNATAGYLSPHTGQTTGMDTPAACYVNIISYNIESDKGGLVNADFEAKVSGVMVLV